MSNSQNPASAAVVDSSYTPHEHEELKNLIRKRREQLRRRPSPSADKPTSPSQPRS
jgi:hypothetical protein